MQLVPSPLRPWLVGLKALLTIGRELRQTREQLTRIADCLEGRPRPLSTNPPDQLDTPTISQTTNQTLADAYDVERQLRRTLGRDPTADEIIERMDGIEV